MFHDEGHPPREPKVRKCRDWKTHPACRGCLHSVRCRFKWLPLLRSLAKRA